MKKIICLSSSLLLIVLVMAESRDSVVTYNLMDSIKAAGFMSNIQVKENGNKKGLAGIKCSQVAVYLDATYRQKMIVFSIPDTSKIIATGLEVKKREKGKLAWKFDWQENETYKLFISMASDSAENFVVYSGYIYIPQSNNWKLIGTCRIDSEWGTIKAPGYFYTTGKRNETKALFTNIWVLRNNGSWKNMSDESAIATPPIILPFPNIDSARQVEIDQQLITHSISSGKTESMSNKDGLYYTMMKEGNGRQVLVNDTVTIFYKGHIFDSGIVFDQSKKSPSRFPLNRLIRGWQVGVPLCKVGGKIKLLVPSGLAYSIRTRAAKIPPNSILVFEIEVVDVKPSQ